MVELAIVLAVAGILVTVGVTSARLMRQAGEAKAMTLHAELAFRAVESFTVTHKRLPSEKEFNEFGLPENHKGSYFYHINPGVKVFSAPEQYCGYKYDNTNLMPPDPVNPALARPYAYAVDFVPDSGDVVFRHLRSYDDFLTELGCKNYAKTFSYSPAF